MILWVFGLWVWGTALRSAAGTGVQVLLAAVAVPALALFWKSPAYGIVAVMFFASGFLPADFVDVRLPIGGGLEMRDLMLLLMFGLAFLRQLVKKTLPLPLFPAGVLLAIFFVFVTLALFNALFFENVPSNWALSDARILAFYLLFFIAAWGIEHERALSTMLVGSFVIADITALVILLQQILGSQQFLVAGMTDTTWGVWDSTGGTRVVPPGILNLYFMNLVSIALVLIGKKVALLRVLGFMQTLLLSVALVLTFTRAAWVATAISVSIILLLAAFIYRKYLRYALAVVSVVASLILISSLILDYKAFAAGNAVVQGIVDRFSSMLNVNDTLESNSLQWRLFEYQEASKAIAAQPITGVGLGNSYRPVTVFQGEDRGLWTDNDISSLRIDRFTRYVHSSYLAVPLKVGIPAFIILLGFLGAAIVTSFSFFTILPDATARALVLAIGTGLIGLLQWSTLHAHLMLASSTAMIGLVVGLLAAIGAVYAKNPGFTESRSHPSSEKIAANNAY